MLALNELPSHAQPWTCETRLNLLDRKSAPTLFISQVPCMESLFLTFAEPFSLFNLMSVFYCAIQSFKEKYRLPFTLLADEGNKVRKEWGVPADLFGALPGRQTYVLDRNGVVRLVYNNQFQPEKHIDETLKFLQSLWAVCLIRNHVTVFSSSRHSSMQAVAPLRNLYCVLFGANFQDWGLRVTMHQEDEIVISHCNISYYCADC